MNNYIVSITDRRNAVWYCSSTTEKIGEKYDHVKDFGRALPISLWQARRYKKYYETLGYKVRITPCHNKRKHNKTVAP